MCANPLLTNCSPFEKQLKGYILVIPLHIPHWENKPPYSVNEKDPHCITKIWDMWIFWLEPFFPGAKGKLFAREGLGTVSLQENLSAGCGDNKPGLRSWTPRFRSNDWEGHLAKGNIWGRKWEHEETCKQFKCLCSNKKQCSTSSAVKPLLLHDMKNSDSSSPTSCQHRLGIKAGRKWVIAQLQCSLYSYLAAELHKDR